MGTIGKYSYNLFLAYDQFINAVFLGDPDESLSGRLGRAMQSKRPKWWVFPMARANDFLWLKITGEVDHCLNSVEPEERPYEKELWSWITK